MRSDAIGRGRASRNIETGTHGAFDSKAGELSSECTARAAQSGNPGSERFGAKPTPMKHDGGMAGWAAGWTFLR